MKHVPPKLQPWFDARRKFRLTNAEVQMARELGMNPKKFGSLANERQEPWKSPLNVFISNCYHRRFGRHSPEQVRSLEEVVVAEDRRKEQKLARKSQEGSTASANGESTN